MIRTIMRASALALLVAPTASRRSLAQSAPTAAGSGTAAFPSWAFPNASPDLPGAKPPFDTIVLLHLPKSTRAFTMAQVKNTAAPPDWYPATHGPMPASVARGRPGAVWACGYCHLPDGQGRAENATLAGLPASYIVAQVAAIRSRERHSAMPGWGPSSRMTDAADSVREEDLAEAARYFSRQRAKARYRVVERAEIPLTFEAGGLYSVRPGTATEPLGHRIIEITTDLERHEMRDMLTTFTAWVPPGSVREGRRIATSKGNMPSTNCVSCHGPGLRGGALAPPIAGRSPSYVFRQLYGFRTGARGGSRSALMQAMVAPLSDDQLIALSAYVGSLRP